MTSEEYLRQIATTEVIDCTKNDKAKKRIANIFPVAISVIAKDLEVLEILKKQITITEERIDNDFGNYTMIYKLNITNRGLKWDDFIKIRDWIIRRG